MNGLNYISNEDRARLIQLNDALRSVSTVEEQREIRAEIEEIESRRKPLHECTLDECTELRTLIWSKFERLNRTGKYHIAQQFKLALQQIEIRQGLLHQEMARAEAKRKLEEQQGKAERLEKAKKDDRSAGKAKPQQSSSRWTSGVGSLD